MSSVLTHHVLVDSVCSLQFFWGGVGWGSGRIPILCFTVSCSSLRLLSTLLIHIRIYFSLCLCLVYWISSNFELYFVNHILGPAFLWVCVYGAIFWVLSQILCSITRLGFTIAPNVGILIFLLALICSSNSLTWYGEDSYVRSLEPGAKVVIEADGQFKTLGDCKGKIRDRIIQ